MSACCKSWLISGQTFAGPGVESSGQIMAICFCQIKIMSATVGPDGCQILARPEIWPDAASDIGKSRAGRWPDQAWFHPAKSRPDTLATRIFRRLMSGRTLAGHTSGQRLARDVARRFGRTTLPTGFSYINTNLSQSPLQWSGGAPPQCFWPWLTAPINMGLSLRLLRQLFWLFTCPENWDFWVKFVETSFHKWWCHVLDTT